MKNKNTNQGSSVVIILVILTFLIVGGTLYYKGAKNEKEALEAPLSPEETGIMTPPPPEVIVEVGAEDEMIVQDGMMEVAPLKEFAVEGKNFEFSTKEIRVKKGDFVRINFTSTNGMHDLRVSGYDVGTAVVNTGESSSVDFKADKAGTFEFYCSVGTHRQMGMVGKLIVE